MDDVIVVPSKERKDLRALYLQPSRKFLKDCGSYENDEQVIADWFSGQSFLTVPYRQGSFALIAINNEIVSSRLFDKAIIHYYPKTNPNTLRKVVIPFERI